MNCPVCLTNETDFFRHGTDCFFEATDEIFNLFSCRNCGCLFLDPMPGIDKITSFYPKHYWWPDESGAGCLSKIEGLYRRFVLIDHVRFISHAARTIESRGSPRILDVGCGSGVLLNLLHKKGFEVSGVDLSIDAAEIVKQNYGLDVAVGSIEDVFFDPGSFDVVVLLHTLEHVPNPRAMLKEVIRILKPSGRLVVQVPNIDSLQFRLFGVRWYGLDVPRHLIDYSQSSILKLLSEVGLNVKRLRHFNLRDNAPAFVSSLFPSLDPVSRAVRLGKRGFHESPIGRWFCRFIYLSLVLLFYPLAAFEAALGRGATVMVEAEKPGENKQ